MIKFTTIYLVLIFLLFFGQPLFSSGIPVGGQATDSKEQILVNQVGYLPNSVKVALLRLQTDRFEVVDANTGKTVFTGIPGPFNYWDQSGDSVCAADFSTVIAPGKYKICINKQVCSHSFEIGEGVYSNLAKASLKAFYLNRSGMPIKQEFGGKWARLAGHPDTSILVHASAATDKRPEGFKISSPGGWYDAGDYNKYIVNSSISTYTLLLFCQMYPEYCKKFTDNIPESSNTIPDVMDELLYNLRWMLTMQDPDDGGVYHKLTNKKFCDFVMPDLATEPRYVVYKSTAASLGFAATMAMASRILAKSETRELKTLGKTCIVAAKKAYTWAQNNPGVFYKNPYDISTGEYDDTKVKDEFFWASTELGLAENNQDLILQKDLNNLEMVLPTWDNSGMLGVLSLALNEDPKTTVLTTEAQKKLVSFADKLVGISESSPYKVSLEIYKWGSNSDVANQAMIKIVANRISPDKKYFASVQGDVDYLLGRNATGYCFVTGFGAKQVMNIHHRPSGADGVEEPCPGFLAGGPNTVVLNDCPEITRSKFPAKSFSDSECSYSTNEVAINWNAPLFFLMGAMDALDK